jgi:peptidoglycan/LPS O-acetylase OafA/YrhL
MLRGPEAAKLTRFIRPAFWIFIAGFILFEVSYRIYVRHLYDPIVTGYGLSTIGFTLIDIFGAIVILLSLDPNSFVYSIFTIRWLRRLGEISYGFYVFHDIPRLFYAHVCSHFLKHIQPSFITLATAALGLVCTLVISFLSFRFFETPFLRLKDRFSVHELKDLRSSRLPFHR